MYRRGSRIGWNLCQMQISQLGFGYTAKICGVFPCRSCAPRNLRHPILRRNAWISRLGRNLIAKHPERVNTSGGLEGTPMHVAALKGHPDVLSLLIGRGADVDGRGKDSDIPLHRATLHRKPEAGRYLLERGAVVSASATRAGLHFT